MTQGKLTVDQHTRDHINEIFDSSISDGKETNDENPAPINRLNDSSSDNCTVTFSDSPTIHVEENNGGDFLSYH